MKDTSPTAPQAETATETVHLVDGLPHVYAVIEQQTGDGVRFVPKLSGETFRWVNGDEVGHPTLEEAVQGLYEFLGRMQ